MAALFLFSLLGCEIVDLSIGSIVCVAWWELRIGRAVHTAWWELQYWEPRACHMVGILDLCSFLLRNAELSLASFTKQVSLLDLEHTFWYLN